MHNFNMVFKLFYIIFIVLINGTVNSKQSEPLRNHTLNTVFNTKASSQKQENLFLQNKRDKNDEFTADDKPLIIKPKHLERNNEADIDESKVTKTSKNLHETKALRDQIQIAVKDNVYVVASTAKNNTNTSQEKYNASTKDKIQNSDPNDQLQLLSQFDNLLNTKEKMESLYSALNEMDKMDDLINDSEEDLEDELKANVVDSYYGTLKEDNLYNTYGSINFVPSKKNSRENLELTFIEEYPANYSFFNYNINVWKPIKINGTLLLIGFTNDSIFTKYEKSENLIEINFSNNISAIDTFVRWNSLLAKTEGIILISLNTTIHWFYPDSQSEIWKWHIGKNITAIKYFKTYHKEYLAILLDKSSRNGSITINVYEFNYKTREFWIIQEIPLEHLSSEIIFLNTGRDIVVGVAQVNYALLFTYNVKENSYIRFEHITRIESHDISSITGFNMGGHSYIGIGGSSPKILRYDNGHFIPQTILNEDFGLVEYFLPIPIRTYRDDLLLLVQHKINFDTHSLSVVEGLIWNGLSFHTSKPVPCKISNVTYAFGVHCLLDPARKNGLHGAGILETGKSISVIVPRYETASSCFKIHTQFKENVEQLESQKLFDYFKKMDLEQEVLINKIIDYLNMTDNESNMNSDYLFTPELYSSGDIDEIYINDNVWTQMDSEVDYEQLIFSLKEIENNVKSRIKRGSENETLEIDIIEIDDLMVSHLNGGVLHEDILINEGELNFNGTIFFENSLIVDESLEITIKPEYRLLESEVLETDVVTIDGNLKFLNINDIGWNNFLSTILITIYPDKIGKLQVEGEIFLDQGLSINILNNLTFPTEYLVSSGPAGSTVTAPKFFNQNLSANAIDTGGLINGVDPFNFITLSENQHIAGVTTFSHLDVTELLEVNGSITSHESRTYFSNPDLLSSNIIQSACDFKHLFVNGEVNVVENLNNYKTSQIFDDIIYKTNNQVTIVAPKSVFLGNFETLSVSTNSLNGINLNDYVLKESNVTQELNITNILGNVYVNYLTLNEYNSQNITNLIKKCILLNEIDDHNLNLTFKQPISTSDLIIHQKLNNKPVDSFRNTYNDFELTNAEFDGIAIKNLNTICNITGLYLINGISVKNLKQKGNLKLSQIILEDVVINELIIHDGINVKTINGVPSNNLMVLLDKFYDLPHMITSGVISVESALIVGNLHVQLLNQNGFENLQSNVIWLDRPNFFHNQVKFFDSISIHNNLQIDGILNKININRILPTLIYKHQQEPVVKSLKKFTQPILLLNDVKINMINNIPYDYIAKKNSLMNLNTLNIIGNLTAQKIYIKNKLNNFSCTNLDHLAKYDDASKSFVIGNIVRFTSDEMQIKNLQIDNVLNEFELLKDFLDNLIFKTKPIIVNSKINFLNMLKFKHGIFMENLNELKNLSEIFSNIVIQNEKETLVVESSIIFKDNIEASNIEILNNLHAINITHFNLNKLLENTIKLDSNATLKQLNFSPGSLDGNDLKVLVYNDRNMMNLVTLNSVQNLTGCVEMPKVYLKNNIDSCQINEEINFKNAADNSLMISGNQNISALTSIKSLKVLNNLNIQNFVDRKNLSNCATMNSFIELQSPISINNLLTRNVETNDYISGIDFNNWYQKSLWHSAKEHTEITGNWVINNLTTDSQVLGMKVVNDKNLEDLMKQMDVHYFEPHAKPHKNNLRLLCEDTNSLISEIYQRVNFVKYFKLFLKHSESDVINRISFFNITDNNFMLVNVNCFSKIYHLNNFDNNLTEIIEFKSGVIKDIIFISTNDVNNLNLVVTNSHFNECILNGVHIWNFNLKSVKYLGEHENGQNYSIIHKALDNDKFYAMNEGAFHVAEMRINSSQQKIWNLPKNTKNTYRFLPTNLEFTNDVALSNGQHLVILSPNIDDINDEITSSIYLNKTNSSIKNEGNIKHQYTTILSIVNDLQKLFANMKINLRNITNIKCNETNMNYSQKYTSSSTDKGNFSDQVQNDFGYNSSYVLKSIESILNKIDLINSKYLQLKKIENEKTQRDESYLQIHKQFDECLNQIKMNLLNLKFIKNSTNEIYEKSVANNYIKNLQEINKYYVKLYNLKQNISEPVEKEINENLNNSTLLKNIFHFLNDTKEILRKLDLTELFGNNTLNIKNMAKLITDVNVTVLNITKLMQSMQSNLGDNNITDIKETPEYEVLINNVLMFNQNYTKISNYLKQLIANETININRFIKNINCCNCRGLVEMDLNKFMEPINSTALPLIETENEFVIGKTISNDLIITDNPYLPNKYSGGEILALNVGTGENRPLIAVISSKNHNIFNKNFDYVINIYFDVMQGDLFQALSAYNPRNLTAIHIERETFLAFVENDYNIKVMTYRGVEGFIEFTKIKTEKFIKSLHNIHLQSKNKLCKNNYLVAVTENEIHFYQIISSGHCISDIKLNCFV